MSKRSWIFFFAILLKWRLLHSVTNQSASNSKESFEPINWLLDELQSLCWSVARILGYKDHFSHFISNYLSDKVAAGA
jgi:hypothetical protein